MNQKLVNIMGLVLLLFLCAIQINAIFAGTTTQYQFYRLSDNPSDDRRPKLAINDQGIVWIVWESDRDGDFDLFIGKTGLTTQEALRNGFDPLEEVKKDITRASYYPNNKMICIKIVADRKSNRFTNCWW